MSASEKTTSKSYSKTAMKNKKSILSILATILTILSLAMSDLLVFGLISNARKACTNTFNQAYEETKDNTFNKFKKKAFDYFEAKNHVSNRATLTIGNIKKTLWRC